MSGSSIAKNAHCYNFSAGGNVAVKGDVDISGSTFVGGNVNCSTAPTSGDHLCNKTYVDAAGGGPTVVTDSFTVPLSGPWTGTQNATVNVVKIGNVVTFEITELLVLGDGATSGNIAAAAGSIPASYRPASSSVRFNITVYSEPNNIPGSLLLLNSGAITLTRFDSAAGRFSTFPSVLVSEESGIRTSAVTYRTT